MKSDFLLAITQLSAEKNLSKEVVLSAVEAALVSAYRKDNFSPSQNIAVKIDPNTGRVQVWAEKKVVERVLDSRSEVSFAEARRLHPEVQVGEAVMVEDTPGNAGRIAAQTAKQVILQRLHEAEHTAIMEEFSGREGDIVTGTVQRVEPRQLFVDLGRTEGIFPFNEQVMGERYRAGQRLRAVILEVIQTPKGPRVVLSRSHPNLLRRLFEMEVPEISSGIVEIKGIAREAGSRSKVAVGSRQEGVDPVGCCVGLRGIRIQNVVNELHGEKIDVVQWSADPASFIAGALSPAQIIGVELKKEEKGATVVVPDRQLSLAIGKEGQNVRLAAKLTGWRIDIKSASVAEAEKAEAARVVAEAAAKAKEEALAARTAVPEEVAEILEPVLTPAGAEEAAPVPSLEPVFIPPLVSVETPRAGAKPRLRFAEDIMAPAAKAPSKTKKKQKKGVTEREGEETARGKRARRELDVPLDEEEY